MKYYGKSLRTAILAGLSAGGFIYLTTLGFVRIVNGHIKLQTIVDFIWIGLIAFVLVGITAMFIKRAQLLESNGVTGVLNKTYVGSFLLMSISASIWVFLEIDHDVIGNIIVSAIFLPLVTIFVSIVLVAAFSEST